MIEDAPLTPPYALITAGQSLHWMDWYVVLPHFQQLLTPRGKLVILGPEVLPTPWEERLIDITRRYSTNQEYRPVDLIAELEQRQLFQRDSDTCTIPITFAQPINDYIEAYHAKSSLSRDHMTREAADAFDEEFKALLTPFASDGIITVQVVSLITWGRPQNPQHLEGNRA